MVKTPDKDQKEKMKLPVNMDGNKFVQRLGREILPYCQVVFVLVYTVIAFLKWNSY